MLCILIICLSRKLANDNRQRYYCKRLNVNSEIHIIENCRANGINSSDAGTSDTSGNIGRRSISNSN